MNGTALKYLPIGLVLALIAGGVGYGTTRAQVSDNKDDIEINRKGITRIYPRLTGIEIKQAEQETRAEERYDQTQKTLDEIKRLIRERR